MCPQRDNIVPSLPAATNARCSRSEHPSRADGIIGFISLIYRGEEQARLPSFNALTFKALDSSVASGVRKKVGSVFCDALPQARVTSFHPRGQPWEPILQRGTLEAAGGYITQPGAHSQGLSCGFRASDRSAPCLTEVPAAVLNLLGKIPALPVGTTGWQLGWF